jgi:hypothetical protein
MAAALVNMGMTLRTNLTCQLTRLCGTSSQLARVEAARLWWAASQRAPILADRGRLPMRC